MITTLILYILLSSNVFTNITTADIQDYNDSPQELSCLAHTLYFEARGEPTEGIYEVAKVILNRVHSDLYPNTICGVVYQQGQFTYNHNIVIDNKNKIYDKMCLISINSMYNWKENDNVMYYHNLTVFPKWAKTFIKTKTIGNHIFYKRRYK